jgi:acyl transferase domain-containing protein
MFQKNLIPAHIGVKREINRNFSSLESHQILIPFEAKKFPTKEVKRRKVLVNNFGAAGGNTTLLLEEPPSQERAEAVDRPTHLIAISAKTSVSLKANKKRLFSFLDRNKQVSLADLSYTTTSRRQHYRHRFITAATSLQDLQEALLVPDNEHYSTQVSPLVFVFTGQGSIYTGVAQSLFHRSRQFADDLLQFNLLTQSHGFPSFLPLLDPVNDLSSLSAVQTQLGQICVQMSLYRLYRSWGMFPQAVVGHSLGDFAALYASGILTASDTILITGRRAVLMEQYCVPGTHTMLAVRASAYTTRELLASTAGGAEVACINGPNDVVLSGPVGAIRNAARILANKGIKSTQLPIPFACHSAQLTPIVEPLQNFAEELEFNGPRIPLLSPLLGAVIDKDGIVNARYLGRHLRERVDFVSALETSALLFSGQDMQFVEIGPHPVCTGMIQKTLGQTVIPSLSRGEDAFISTANSLGALYRQGQDIDWEEYNRDSVTSSVCLTTLPSYAFDEKNYWIEYKNNWALTKGEGETLSPTQVSSRSRGPATASVQTLLRESSDETSVMAEFESDLTHPALHDAIAGHAINGIGLCPSVSFKLLPTYRCYICANDLML